MVADLTEYNVVVTVLKVNDEDDMTVSNNTASGDLFGIAYIPDRKVVAEEATGTWCTWCPRGAVFMDEASLFFENFIGIAVHNQDPMMVPVYDTGLNTYIGGYPTVVLDRDIPNILPNNYAAFSQGFDIIQEQLDRTAPVAIDVEADLDPSTNELKVTVSGEFLIPINNEWRFNAVISEDGVTGSGAGWEQINIYSGGGQGEMGGYENLPNPVPANQMVYNHVGRAILGGWAGQAGSLPATIARGETHSHTFTTTLDAGWDLANLHVIGFVVNQANGVIINGNAAEMITVGNEEINFDHSLAKVVPNPSSGMTYVQINLEAPTDVVMTVLNSVGQQVAYKDYGKLTGELMLPVNGSNFENGMYYIHLSVGDKLVTKKLNLIK